MELGCFAAAIRSALRGGKLWPVESETEDQRPSCRANDWFGRRHLARSHCDAPVAEFTRRDRAPSGGPTPRYPARSRPFARAEPRPYLRVAASVWRKASVDYRRVAGIPTALGNVGSQG